MQKYVYILKTQENSWIHKKKNTKDGKKPYLFFYSEIQQWRSMPMELDEIGPYRKLFITSYLLETGSINLKGGLKIRDKGKSARKTFTFIE
jgi:hypothetical protein